MRVGFVRNVGLAALGLAVAALGACNDDPLSFDNDQTTDIFVNPTYMVVQAGGESKLVSRALNQGLEPTFAEIDPGTPTCVTVADDPDATELQPPGLFVVTGGFQLGSCVISLTSGGITKTVDVTVIGAGVELTCPTGIRVGDAGQITARLVGADEAGTTVEPFDQATDLVWTSDDATVVTVSEDGSYSAPDNSGAATISATWTYVDGEANVATRQGSCTINVSGSTPVTAAFADAVDGSLGTIEAGAPVSFDVVVFDEFDNLTFLPEEITGITVTSSDPGVATVTGIREELTDSEVALAVEVEPQTAGDITISGTVQTTAGDLPFSADLSVVVTPTITSITPEAGAAGDEITITGANFGDLTDTDVLFSVAGANRFSASTGVVSVSATEIVVRTPTFGEATDFDVAVQVGPSVSDPGAWSLTTGFDEAATEPANDSEATAPTIQFPFNFTGTISPAEPVAGGAFGAYDLFRVVVDREFTFQVDLDWDNGGNDVDVYIWDASVGEPDGGFVGYPTGWMCGASGGTSGRPESTGSCTVPAGEYLIWIYDFGPDVSNYTVIGAGSF